MKIVKIIGKEKVEDRVFHAEVVFPSDNCYEVTVRDPFIEAGEIEADQEERLRWYFEDHLSSPFTDRERAKRAEKSIAFYGESLFSNLFIQNEALTEWRNLVHDLDKIRVQVYSKDPAFQALHWESLKDPQESKAFCLMGVEFIRTSGAVTPDLKVHSGSCLNLLMVTARPGGKDDIEYRTITRPVVETIEKNRMQVRVHLLRPPTLQSLTEHLREKKGFYHIVHFDVHGCVLSFPQYETLMERKSRGRRSVETYMGTMAFIYLVAEGGGHDLVSADMVAELLREAHVPVCFLNACQSGMATLRMSEDEPEKRALTLDASLAMKFLERGVRLVLGMAWSLTVIGAQIMMKALYDELTRGEEPGTALNKSRQAMFEKGCRFSSPGVNFFLEDWLLPVNWGKGDFSWELKEPDQNEWNDYLELLKRIARELEDAKTEGQYGFLGRDVDILSIESLLLERNILLIKGMGGTGKTTLLGHMAQWWMKTGWVDHVFYFGYDKKPYHAEEILNTIAGIVMPQGEYGRFLATPDVEMKAMALTLFLKESRNTPAVLLILDNMESITCMEQAVGSRLEKPEQDKLVQVLRTLMQSSLKILLGSRSDEAWLGENTFRDSIYVLEGLDRVSRYYLAEKIMRSTPIDESSEFNRLMDLLAGYPLAMEIILPNMGTRSVSELWEMLTGADVDFKGGRISEEIFKCINISFSLLTSKARESFLVFAPFTSFLNAGDLEEYLKELHTSGIFANLTLADLEESIRQGKEQGLLKEIFPRNYSIQPVFPFFLRQKVKDFLANDGKEALEKAFCNYMKILAGDYVNKLYSTDLQEKQKGVSLFKQDRENLYKGLHWALDNEDENFYNLYLVFATFYYQNPDLCREAIELLEGVVEKLEQFKIINKTVLVRHAHVIGNLGSQYLQNRNFSEARTYLKKSLERLQHEDINQDEDRRKETGAIYHQLGNVAEKGSDWVEAKRNYQEALKIFEEFNEKKKQAGPYYQLGMVAQAEKNWQEAKWNYQEALKIFEEFNEEDKRASTYHQLGMVAQKEGNLEEAKQNYRKALSIYQKFDIRYNQASTYHQLGKVAETEGRHEEARQKYLDALNIYQESQDRYNQASTYIGLGVVAAKKADYISSLQYFAIALEIYKEYNDENNIKTTIGNLFQLNRIGQLNAARDIEQLNVKEETKEVLRDIWKRTKK